MQASLAGLLPERFAFELSLKWFEEDGGRTKYRERRSSCERQRLDADISAIRRRAVQCAW